LKVLHVITQLGPGGRESQLYECIRGTSEQCTHRVVALAQGGIYRDRLADHGIVVRDLPRRGRGDPHRLFRLVKEIRIFGPDIVHGHLFSGNLYGFLATRLAHPLGDRPALLTVRVTTSPQRTALLDRLERMAFRGSRLVVVNAEALLPEVCEAYDLPPERVRFLPNVLSPERFVVEASREEVRRGLDVSPEDVVVGHISSFSPEKRHDLVLRAFAKARAREPRLRLLLVGGGPGGARLERLAGELGLGEEVHWLGWAENVPRLLKGMDITISASDREGAANAVLESLAMGVPVVATGVGGTPEALQDGRAGVLVPPGDDEGLSEGMVRLAQSPEERRRLGEFGRDFVWRRHGPAEVYPRLLSVYEDILALRGKVTS
jgi:glycosyltransferase involved in cell wall biosynthesis